MNELVAVVVSGSLLVLCLLGMAVFLIVLNSSRRHRHRAELAELRLTHDREVMEAEREGQRQTLQEVGRELHDNLGQLLTVVQMGLRAELDDDGTKKRVREAVNTLELSIEEVRRMGRSLNSDLWEHRTFSEAITAEAERIERMGLARVHLQLLGEPPDLSPDAKTILFRVFQEVMNNALRHARADRLEVLLQDGADLSLRISDNGRGYDLTQVKTGAGTVNIRRRCELIGFSAELSSSPGQGTTWTISRKAHGT